ncbi:MAG: 3-phosphoglycerate dehydrogenase [Candidatus Micrarchaeota archaeon]|nr:3-phosphoglycerate dehydrogenase [Candidatus Micrarchaeota archaeon]
MKILVADLIDQTTLEKLKEFGQVSFRPADLANQLADSDILVVRSATKVNAELLKHSTKLKYIIRAGVGLDNIDLEECKKRGIEVFNTPQASTNAVAELTIGLIFCLLRKICYANKKLVIEKKWEKENAIGLELENKTLGIIGMGRIGQAVAKKASALGMKVQYFDKTDKNLAEYPFVDLDKLLSTSDIISIHLSIPKEQAPFLKEEHFKKIKKGAFLLNLSRGYVLDENALYQALKTNQLNGAALDVFSSEPYFGPLTQLENVILTPHIGASTFEAQQKIGQEIIQIIKNIFISKNK